LPSLSNLFPLVRSPDKKEPIAMKLQLSRRDFSLVAANFVTSSSLFGLNSAFAQAQKTVNLGTFGSIDAQNYIRAKGLATKTFGPNVKTEFMTVRAGSEVMSAMAGGSLDMCNLGSSPLVVGYANGVPVSLVYIYKNIIDSEVLVVQTTARAFRLRQGNEALCVFNLSFNPIGWNTGTGTTAPDVTRAVRETRP